MQRIEAMTVAVLLMTAAGLAAAQAPAPAGRGAWTPRVDYDCNGTVLSVWYEPKAVVLFVDGELETLQQLRAGSNARYAGDRREWQLRGGTARLGAVKGSAATQQECRVTGLSSWRPHAATRRYTCQDGLTVAMTPELEWASFTFRGDTWRMREVTARGSTLYTDGVRSWRGSPASRLLVEADGLAAIGCHPGVLDEPATLSGTVTMRTRQALTAGAIVEVRLVDVSKADAPSVPLARQVIVTSGEQVPIPFSLTYMKELIEAGHRYHVQATISEGGRIRYRTTTAHSVFESGAPDAPVTILVQPSR